MPKESKILFGKYLIDLKKEIFLLKAVEKDIIIFPGLSIKKIDFRPVITK